MTDGTGTSSYVWDSRHRLSAATNGGGQSVSYGYDLAGRVTSLQYPRAAQDSQAPVVTRTYDAAVRLSSITRSRGITE